MTKAIKINKCAVCGNKKFKFLFFAYDRMLHIAGRFTVKQCLTCSLVFLDPMPSQEALKKYYPSKKYYSYTSNKKRGLFERLRAYLTLHYYTPTFFSTIIATFIQNVPAMPSYVAHGKILDIGCGAGDTLLLLKKLGWHTYGVDMDAHAIANAKKNGLKNVNLGTYKHLRTYPDNYFDAIRLHHVIEHIDNPGLCLELIRKKLKKNGELVIGTPNADSIVAVLFKSYWYNLDIPRHLFLFSPKTLASFAVKKGYSVEKVEYCQAGGIIGSIEYFLDSIFQTRLNLIHKIYFMLPFYPFDWLLNKVGSGDLFVIRARIKQHNL